MSGQMNERRNESTNERVAVWRNRDGQKKIETRHHFERLFKSTAGFGFNTIWSLPPSSLTVLLLLLVLVVNSETM